MIGKTAWVLVIGVVLLIVLVLGASWLVPFGVGRGYGYGWGMMGPMMMGGGIFMVLFWILIIGGAIWLIQALAPGGSTGLSAPNRETPLDTLRVKVRFAKGEITIAQFNEMTGVIFR